MNFARSSQPLTSASGPLSAGVLTTLATIMASTTSALAATNAHTVSQASYVGVQRLVSPTRQDQSHVGGSSSSEGVVGLTAAATLVRYVGQVFGSVSMVFGDYLDTEEGWSKLTLTVDTNVEDPGRLFEMEDAFYFLVDSNRRAQDELGKVVVRFL